MNVIIKLFITIVILIVALTLAGVSKELTGTSLIGIAVCFGAYAAIKAVWRYGKEETAEEIPPGTEVEKHELDKS